MTILTLRRLERRLVPSGVATLISSAGAGMASGTAGGASFTEPTNGALPGQRHVSADGRFVALVSRAANLVIGQQDANNSADIFIHDRILNTTVLVSHTAGSPTTAANDVSFSVSMSEDGRYVTFASEATNIVTTTPAGPGYHVYLYDRLSATSSIVDHAFDNALLPSDGVAKDPVISADGGYIAYVGSATDLVGGFTLAGNPGQNQNIYLYERATGVNTLVSHAAGSPAAGTVLNQRPMFSGDGRYIGFESRDGSLIAGWTPAFPSAHVFLHDRLANSNALVTGSKGAANTGASADSYLIAISTDGRYVSFATPAKDIIAGFVDNNGGTSSDVYRFDRVTHSTMLVSRALGSTTAGSNGPAYGYGASDDGGIIVFTAENASNLVAGASGVGSQVYAFDALTGETTLVSRAAGTVTTGGNGRNDGAKISPDGRMIVYLSRATDLVAGFADGNANDAFGGDVFAFDRLTGQTSLVSHAAGQPTTSGDRRAWLAGISGDGNWVVFSGDASNLVAGLADRNGTTDVFLRDLTTGAIHVASPAQAASVSAGGNSGMFSVGFETPRVTPDGRFVLFLSPANNLAIGQTDTNWSSDVFLHDRKTGQTRLVSHRLGSATTAGNGGSSNAAVSADGRYVAFCSQATDLVANFVDNNGPERGNYLGTDVYLWDGLTGVTTLVSHVPGSAYSGGDGVSGSYQSNAWPLSISADGRYLAYRSQANDLVAGYVDGNGNDTQGFLSDIFLYDRQTGENALVSHKSASATAGSEGDNQHANLSADGRYLTYVSTGTDLVAGYSGPNFGNVYLYDRTTGVNNLVSHVPGAANAGSNGAALWSHISTDGRFVVYTSLSTNLVPGQIDTNGLEDVYLYDRLADANVLVSHAADNPVRTGGSRSQTNYTGGSVSDDGRFVSFISHASNLVAGFVDGNGVGVLQSDVFLFDRLTGSVTLVSHTAASPMTGGNGGSDVATISGDGRFVAFLSASKDLVAGVTGGPPDNGSYSQEYVFDRLTGLVALLSHAVGQPGEYPNHGVSTSAINRDGSVVVFGSSADNLVADDRNGFHDVFAHVTGPPRVQSVQIADDSPQRSVVRLLTVTFDQPVFFAGDPALAFVLTGATGSVQLAAGSAIGTSVTLTFSGSLTQFGSLIDGKYTLRVWADQVSNIGPLDGNNDGVGGDDFTFGFHRLYGDADGNGSVDALDFRAFRAAFGSPSFVFDLDNDGDTDAADFAAFRGRFGVSV